MLDALHDTRVVLLNGARQTGKTTLVRAIAEGPHRAQYFTLDDPATLAAARTDPSGFVQALSGPVIIDEVQRAPELFPAIKVAVDRDPAPGRFLLTGSANVMVLPRLSESLAGRMEILTLAPLAQAEIEDTGTSVCDALFGEDLPATPGAPLDRSELIGRIVRGGYPEPVARSTEDRRAAWFASYVDTILQRDVRDISGVEGLAAFPRLLALLAARSGSVLNSSDISRTLGLPYTSLQRYLAVLQATFLVRLLPAWAGNLEVRLAKAPKVLLSDTGLVAACVGANAARLQADGSLLGGLLETFVAAELMKSGAWSRANPSFCHFRTAARHEVDLVLEDRAGRVVGIEVKAAQSVAASDFSGLRELARLAGDRFVRGVVLYTGGAALPFGPKLCALPLDVLWRNSANTP